MNKKRGVLISTMNHNKTVTKSKSAHTNPLPHTIYDHSLHNQYNQGESNLNNINRFGNQQPTQSNLLSQEPQRLVDQAYYTYQDPDSMPYYQSNRLEENQQYVIESMQKRKQYLQNQRREQEKRKIMQKTQNNLKKNPVQAKQISPNKAKSVKNHQIKRFQITQTKELAQKQKIKADQQLRKQKKQVNLIILKPKPLIFSVNMFEKGNLSPRHRQMNEQSMMRLSEKISLGAKTSRCPKQETQYNQKSIGQNINCKKLPFRFQGIL